jgi:hypothetical protein
LICAIAGKAASTKCCKRFHFSPSSFQETYHVSKWVAVVFRFLRCPFAHHKMQDQRNHREYEQQVDQSSCYVKHSEAAKPSYQQNQE